MEIQHRSLRKDIKNLKPKEIAKEAMYWLAIVVLFIGCMAFLFYCGGPGIGV